MTQFGRIGVLAQDAQHVGELTHLVRGAGFAVSSTVDVGSALNSLPDADIWVLDVDVDAPNVLVVVDQLDALGKYVIFANDLYAEEPAVKGQKPPLPREIRKIRERRLAQKLRQLAPGVMNQKPAKRALSVWVLAASTGGPEAVMAFLSQLPKPNRNIAFLYAQHTEASALDHLAKTVSDKSNWPLTLVDRPLSLDGGQIYLVSPARQLGVLEGGLLTVSQKPWAGQFSPSLDQVIAKVARVYGASGGAIVFSGMGNDGASSCKMMRYLGGQVWVQLPESCAVDSMPVSVLSCCDVHVNARPAQLAKQFLQFQKRQGLSHE